MGRRRERRRQDDRTADRIAAALALIQQTDERWNGLARFLAHSGMDRDAELLDRLVARAERRELSDLPVCAGDHPLPCGLERLCTVGGAASYPRSLATNYR